MNIQRIKAYEPTVIPESFNLSNEVSTSEFATSLYQKITPYFKYKTSENLSVEYARIRNKDNQEEIEKIYMNCVSCNVKRFDSIESMKKVKKIPGIHLFFCESCYGKSSLEFQKYLFHCQENASQEEVQIFRKMWIGFSCSFQ